MRIGRGKILIGSAILTVSVVVGIAIWLMSGSTPSQPSHAAFVQNFAAATVGAKRSSVLAQWPKKPYQHYSDNFGDECFEWLDDYGDGKRRALYDFCFKNGRLTQKFRP